MGGAGGLPCRGRRDQAFTHPHHFQVHHTPRLCFLAARRSQPVARLGHDGRVTDLTGQGNAEIQPHAIIPWAAVLLFMDGIDTDFRIGHEGPAGQFHVGLGSFHIAVRHLDAGIVVFHVTRRDEAGMGDIALPIPRQVRHDRVAEEHLQRSGRIFGRLLRQGQFVAGIFHRRLRHLPVGRGQFATMHRTRSTGGHTCRRIIQGMGHVHPGPGDQGFGTCVKHPDRQRHVFDVDLFIQRRGFSTCDLLRGAALSRQPERHGYATLIRCIAFITAQHMVIHIFPRQDWPAGKPRPRSTGAGTGGMVPDLQFGTHGIDGPGHCDRFVKGGAGLEGLSPGRRHPRHGAGHGDGQERAHGAVHASGHHGMTGPPRLIRVARSLHNRAIMRLMSDVTEKGDWERARGERDMRSPMTK